MTNKNSILIVMPELYHGGAEKQFRNIIQRIDRKFKICVVIEQSLENRDECLTAKFIQEHPHIQFEFLKGLHAEGTQLKRYFSFVIINFQMLFHLMKKKPSVVIVYTSLGMKTILTAKLFGAKAIYSERNAGDGGDLFFKKNHLFLRNASAIVCNSIPAWQNMQQQNLPAIYIPNGIEMHDMLPCEKTDLFVIIVPARIAQVKNQELVIRALGFLKNERLQVQFIGKVEDKLYYDTLLKLAATLKVSGQIKFIPYTTDILSYYQQANLVILSSRSEGFSSVILESYLYGRYCLLSDIVMNHAVANDNQCYFPLDSPEILANQIMETIYMPQDMLLKTLAENHIYVQENFGMNSMIKKYETLFNKLIKEK